MRQITFGEAKAGMTLARPITDQQGRVIVNSGAKLSSLYISRLEKWGVKELYVEIDGPGGPGGSSAETLAPVMTAVASEPVRRRSLPRGVYRGPDLADRVRQTFSQVQDDVLMITLHHAVRRHLGLDQRQDDR